VLKKLLNLGEDSVQRQIVPAANRYCASVCPKVRVADVIEVDGLTDKRLKTYGLMAHFDFVVFNKEHNPQFAIEFDGTGHNAINDAKKDQICREADLALFRVNFPLSRSSVGQLSFINYLVHLWFLALEFARMQAAGEVSTDEAFAISGFLKPDAEHIFDSEFDLLGPARARFNRFCKRENIWKGPISHLFISELMLGRSSGEYVAFTSFAIEQTKLYGRAALSLKVPNFGRLADVQFSRQELGQYCTALAIDELLEQLKLYNSGSGHILRRQHEVRSEINDLLDKGFSVLMGLSASGDNELTNFAYRKIAN
jgi:Protein of unknown function (DUF2726)